MSHRIFGTPVADVYPLYVSKAERKGRTEAEVREVMCWLTGLTDMQLHQRLEARESFEEFFATVELNPNASLITGSVCGVKVQDVEDPLMQKIRYMDKLVDELARGKAMNKILRAS